MSLTLVWAVLLSSAASSLAQPNEWILAGNPLLSLVAWVPLFWALRRTTSNGAASLLGVIYGFTIIVFQNYWLGQFPNFGFWAFSGVSVAFAGYCALLGPLLRTLLLRPVFWRPFAVGAAWAVFEYLKSNGFLGFPWGLAPYPFYQWPWFIQIADVSGLYLLSWLVVSWNAWLAEGLETRGWFLRGPGIFFAVMVVGLAVYGTWKLLEPRPSRGTVQLSLVQQNGDPWNDDDELTPLRTSVRHSLAALHESHPDLIVWSETSLKYPFQTYRPYYERLPYESPLLKTIRANDAWWLFGNPYAQDFPNDPERASGWVNATVLMNPQAQIVDYYGKIQQVPFAEYVPFWEVPAVRSFFQDVVKLSGTWDLGRQRTIFQIPVAGKAKTMTFATPICFEDAFAWLNADFVREGAEVLVNLTNDSWSKTRSSEYQHYVASLFRAVENRVFLVRSTNSGVTAVVDPTGQTFKGPLPYFTDGHLNVAVPLPKSHELTAYTLYGDWLIVVFAVFVVLELWLFLKQERRRI
jgi:apolipoprotein N-acyltransferase